MATLFRMVWKSLPVEIPTKAVLPTLLEPVGSPSADTRFLQIQTFPGLNYQVQLSTDLKSGQTMAT